MFKIFFEMFAAKIRDKAGWSWLLLFFLVFIKITDSDFLVYCITF